MSKRKKTGGRDFAKGVSGNPGGRPKDPLDVKLAKTMDKVSFARAMHEVLHAPDEALTTILSDPLAPAVSKALASVLLKCIEDGDAQRLEILLKRYIGPVDSTLNLNVRKPTVIKYADGQIEEFGEAQEEGN